MLARADELSKTYRRSFFKRSSSSPLSLSFSFSAELVTSSHLLPVRGAFLWSLPFSSRLAPDFASPAELPFLLFLFPRGLSPSLLSLCFLLFLAPVSSFPTLHLAPFCRRRSLFPFAERDSATAALSELVHRGKMLREGRSNRRTATLISLPAHIPDSNDSYR